MKCVDFLQDVSKILTVTSSPLLALTAVLDVLNGYWRVCLEESYFLLMAENIMAAGWSSALAESTSIDFTNMVPQ